MKTVWTLLMFALVLYGCQTPYSGSLGPGDFDGWIEDEGEDYVCLWNGFDRMCITTIPGRDGKDGKDGVSLIAVHKVTVKEIVEKIVERVVYEKFIEYVPVDVIVNRVVIEYVDREVPVPVFVDRVVEIIKEVFVEVEKIVEVPGETVYVEIPGETIYVEGETVYVEVPGEKEIVYVEVPGEIVYVEVPGEKEIVYVEVPTEEIVEIIKTIYVEVPAEPVPISVTQGATYTEAGYHNPPAGYHRHSFTHTHDGATHTHQVIHPDGEKDDWDREHDGFSGLAHD